MSQESVNRRKELKRALHRRVTEELLEEKAASSESVLSESEMPLVEATEGGLQDDTIQAVGSLRSRKSSKSVTAGLPTVIEVDDLKRPELGDDEKRSTRKSSWVTDFPSSGWATRSTSKALPPQAPSEPAPVVPELFAKLNKPYTSPPTHASEKSKVKQNIRHEEPHIKRLSIPTHDAIREVFKPLDESPQRLGLWLQGSKSSIGSRSFQSAQSQSRRADSPIVPDQARRKEPSSGSDEDRVTPTLTAPDGPVETIVLENIIAKNDLHFDAREERKESHIPDMNSLTSIRRFVNTVVELPFSQRHREEDKDRRIQPATSLPSLRKFSMGMQGEPARSPTSTHTYRTIPVTFATGFGLWDENSFPSPDESHQPTPVRGKDGPFVDTAASPQGVTTDEEYGSSMKRSRHYHSSSLESSTASFRAREIAAVSKRIVVATKDKPLRKNSRFKEVLDDEEHTETPGRPLSPPKSPWKVRLAPGLGGLDGSDDLQLPQQPLTRSYSMADFMKSQDDAGGVWERALQEHAFDIVHKNNEVRKGSMMLSRPSISKPQRPSFNRKGKEPVRYDAEYRRPSRAYDEDVSPGASPGGSPKLSPSSSPLGSHHAIPDSLAGDLSDIVHAEQSIAIPTGQTLGNSDVPDAWARFPSHTRKERNGPAGAGDRINAYDFGGEEWDAPADPFAQRHNNTRNFEAFQQSQLAPSSPVSRLPMGILHLMSRFSKTAELELAVRRSAHRGIRSSISTGSEVTAPELELLGLTTRVFHPQDMMRAPEHSDLDRPVPPSPLFRGLTETDEVGRQLVPPTDWGFPGRRLSSAVRRPSMGRRRSDSILTDVRSDNAKHLDIDAAVHMDNKSELLTLPTAEEKAVLQKPRAARLASSMLSSGQSDDELILGRRSSRDRVGVLLDHEIEMKRFYRRTGAAELMRARGADLTSLRPDPRSLSSEFASEDSVAGPSQPLLKVPRT